MFLIVDLFERDEEFDFVTMDFSSDCEVSIGANNCKVFGIRAAEILVFR